MESGEVHRAEMIYCIYYVSSDGFCRVPLNLSNNFFLTRKMEHMVYNTSPNFKLLLLRRDEGRGSARKIIKNKNGEKKEKKKIV